MFCLFSDRHFFHKEACSIHSGFCNGSIWEKFVSENKLKILWLKVGKFIQIWFELTFRLWKDKFDIEILEQNYFSSKYNLDITTQIYLHSTFKTHYRLIWNLREDSSFGPNMVFEEVSYLYIKLLAEKPKRLF